MHIGLIGQVSCGKTSFLNALAGYPIGNVSLLRETFNPELWEFNSNDNDSYIEIINGNKKIHKESVEKRKNIKYLTEQELIKPLSPKSAKSLLISRNFAVTDYAGINDSSDENHKFYNVFKNNVYHNSIIIYITNAETAFTLQSEVEAFRKIEKLVKEQNNNGNFTKLLIVVNKYDYEDEDYDEIINNAKQIIKNVDFFRISSHHLFINSIKLSGEYYEPHEEFKKEYRKILRTCGIKNIYDDIDHTGDFDNLMTYLTNLNVKTCIIKCKKNNIFNCIKKGYIINLSSKLNALSFLLSPKKLWTNDFMDKIKKYTLNIKGIYNKIYLKGEFMKCKIPSNYVKYHNITKYHDTVKCLILLCEIVMRKKWGYFINKKYIIKCLSYKSAWEICFLTDDYVLSILNIKSMYNERYDTYNITPVNIIKDLKWTDEYKNIPMLIEFAQQPISKIFITNINNSDYYKKIFDIIPTNYKPVMDYINCCIYSKNEHINKLFKNIFGLYYNRDNIFIDGKDKLLDKVFNPPKLCEDIYYKYF